MADIIFTPSGDVAFDRKVRRDHEAGRLNRIASGIYAEPSAEPIEALVRRNWFKIVGKLVPDGVATDRTGMDGKPWRDGSADGAQTDAFVFMSAPRTRDIIRVPGLVINFREGRGPVDGDIPFLGTWLAGPIRKLLDNITPSRAGGKGPSRTTGLAAVEAQLDSLCSTHGEDHLNHIRDAARDLAPLIDRDKEFIVLNSLIGALLRTRESTVSTRQGRARAQGNPLDPHCIERLVKLVEYLQSRAPVSILDAVTTPERKTAGAFIEAYFSNFIEGTEFLVSEAAEIVFEGKMPDARPEDGHDILGTYLQLVDLGARSAAAVDPDAFIDEIQERHRLLMNARPSVRPGVFKTKANKAGDTSFVLPGLVIGTLREGMTIFRSISDPFSRALFVHFLLSDVHPFNDGNGRLSRIMMTKELAAAGLSRIVIPTVYRNDYLDALRALSRRGDPSIFVRSLEFCQRVSAACSAPSTDAAIESWARAYAFCEDGRHARLTIPDPAIQIETRGGVSAPVDYWASIDPRGNPPFSL
ncbi:MAG: Fic family protein [Alphaproteobacteria bacterium]|nr:Fic family protein [Alphaproteobacteria bacterium]MBU2380580.1 Fic family protein [Alphaproteobacteria bacterium]